MPMNKLGGLMGMNAREMGARRNRNGGGGGGEESNRKNYAVLMETNDW